MLLKKGYNEKPIPRTCANCRNYSSELITHKHAFGEYMKENNKRCGLGDSAYRPAPTVYQVCPHCKRLLNGMSSGGSKGFCDEHGEVTPMNSAVVNTHNYRQTVDWSAA